MTFLEKTFYKLTAFWPRPLPTDDESYEKLKVILKEVFDVPDEHETWALLSGLITSTPPFSLRRPYLLYANPCHRIQINKLAHEKKRKIMEAFQKELEEKMRQAAQEESGREELTRQQEMTAEIEAETKTKEVSDSLDSLH